MNRLPVNLATNPIERRLWVRRMHLYVGAVVVALSAANLLLVAGLARAPAVADSETEALVTLRAWSDEVADLLTSADPREARRVAVSVGLANALIEQRAFPWSGLFAMLETSLPDDVRLESIQPVTTVDGVRVSLTAASSSGDSLLHLLAALEERPELVAVYPGRRQLGPDGDLRLSIEALVRGGPDSALAGAGRRP